MEGEGPEQSGRGIGRRERKEDCNEIIRVQRENRNEKSTSKEIVWSESENDKEKDRESNKSM